MIMQTYEAVDTELPSIDDITRPVDMRPAESDGESHADFLRSMAAMVSDSAIANRLDEIADFLTVNQKALT